MSTTALGRNNNQNWNRLPFMVTSDGPETGGISGTLGKNDKPLLGACEERPSTIDPQTGERIYIDQLIPKGAIFHAIA